MKIKLAKSLVLISLLILLLAVAILPVCAQASSEDLPIDMLETPTEVEDLIAHFSQLEFSLVEIRNGEATQNLQIKYQFEGSEEVRGVQADKISFRGSPQISSMNLWFADGEVVQLEVEGERVPPAMANMMLEPMFQTIFLPYFYFDRFVEREELTGLKADQISRSRGTVGDLEVDIIEIEVGEEMYDLISGVIRIAEYEEFLLVTSYELITRDEIEEERVEVQFKVEALEVR